MSDEIRRLFRSRDDRFFGGVCGGLGDFFSIDSTVIRLLFVFVTLFGWPGIILVYLVLLVVVPEKPLASISSTESADLVQ